MPLEYNQQLHWHLEASYHLHFLNFASCIPIYAKLLKEYQEDLFALRFLTDCLVLSGQAQLVELLPFEGRYVASFNAFLLEERKEFKKAHQLAMLAL